MSKLTPHYLRSPAALPRSPRVRHTQRVAADNLLLALRRTTAMVGDADHYAVDEVLTMATDTICGLNEEVQRHQSENTVLRSSLNAAYRASAAAAAQEVESARRATDDARDREAEMVAPSSQPCCSTSTPCSWRCASSA